MLVLFLKTLLYYYRFLKQKLFTCLTKNLLKNRLSKLKTRCKKNKIAKHFNFKSINPFSCSYSYERETKRIYCNQIDRIKYFVSEFNILTYLKKAKKAVLRSSFFIEFLMNYLS